MTWIAKGAQYFIIRIMRFLNAQLNKYFGARLKKAKG